MELFHKMLKTAVAGGASDIHMKTGTPVVFRINRELLAIECANPTQEWMDKVVAQITPAHVRARLEQEREVDFSYFVAGIGRFRTNLFQQRGHWCLAMRYVKTIVPKFEELGLLEQVRQIAVAKLRLLGITEEDVLSHEVDDGVRIWCVLRRSNSRLESMGIHVGDKLLLLQSLRYTKESLESVFGTIYSNFTLFDRGSSFIGVLLEP